MTLCKVLPAVQKFQRAGEGSFDSFYALEEGERALTPSAVLFESLPA